MNNEIKETKTAIVDGKEFGAVQKNSDGHLGAKCNWCGGYGYTNTLTGGSSGCHRCNQTGVEQPTTAELLQRIKELETKK